MTVKGVKAFSPMKVVNINGFRINIIGLSSEKTYQFYEQESVEGLTVEDPSVRLQAFLNHFGHNADFIILISHLGYETDKLFAAKFPEIGLIIGGHSQNKLDAVEKIGQTLIVQAGSDGAYLGRVDLEFGPDKKMTGYSDKLISLRNDPILK